MDKVVTYSSRGVYSRGVASILREMINDVKSNRQLLWQLFMRDLKAKYKQSLLGWLWIILSPVVAVGTFFILNKSGIVRVGNINAPYILYGLIGITFWQVFASGLGSTTGSITSAGSLIQKIRFPNEIIVFSSIAQSLPSFLIRMVIILLLFLPYHMVPSIYFLLFPLFLLPILFLTLGLGFITSLFNAIIRDVASLVSSVVSLLLFLTPIMYVLPPTGLLGKVNTYNPIFFLVVVPRELILFGKTKFTSQFMWSIVLSISVFFFGWFVFHITQKKFVERL